MTDRQKQMIEGYLPSPRDPELDPFDYYVEDMRGRAVRVHISTIAATKDTTIYQVRTDAGRLVHGVWETDPDTFGGGWYTKANLYDNKTDCLNSTHCGYDYWEELRELQAKEVSTCEIG